MSADFDTDVFCVFDYVMLFGTDISTAWDKVQKFQADRSGKTSRVGTSNVDSMLFFLVVINTNPGISAANKIKRT